MKRLKKTLALFTAALFCVIPLFTQSLTAKAEEEPITYYLKYLEDMKEWRYQQLTAWDVNDNHGPLSHVLAYIKDGDTVVVNGEESINLELEAHLKNLTILNANTVLVSAKGIDEVYQHNGVCVLNTDVKDAYIYDTSVCNFNKNVTNLNIIGTDDINAQVGAIGKAGHVKAYDNHKVYYECYHFAPGTLCIINGALHTDPAHYSTTPSGPAASGTTAPSTGNSSASGDYDDVPKTGESHMILWLTGIAAICLLGSYKLRKG